MAGVKGSRAHQRQLHVWLDKELFDALTAAADDEGLTESGYVRKLVKEVTKPYMPAEAARQASRATKAEIAACVFGGGRYDAKLEDGRLV